MWCRKSKACYLVENHFLNAFMFSYSGYIQTKLVVFKCHSMFSCGGGDSRNRHFCNQFTVMTLSYIVEDFGISLFIIHEQHFFHLTSIFIVFSLATWLLFQFIRSLTYLSLRTWLNVWQA